MLLGQPTTSNMTFVFLFILVLNCLVIFAADALLGPPAASATTTTVIALNGTTINFPSSFAQNATLAIARAEGLYAADSASNTTTHESERKGVVGRKGVNFTNSSVSSSESSQTTNGESLNWIGKRSGCLIIQLNA